MALLIRGGSYSQFDPNKMLPRELAAVLNGDPFTTDGKSIWACLAAGLVKRLATYDDMEYQFGAMTEDIVAELTENVNISSANAQAAADYANRAGNNADTKAQNAEQAANIASSVANDLLARKEAGEFNGKDGVAGPQGPQGESGISILSSGMFTLSVDTEGNLWAYYSDDDFPPQFDYDQETGDLYYITPE